MKRLPICWRCEIREGEMGDQHISELLNIFRAVHFVSPSAFSFAGRLVNQQTPTMQPPYNPYPQSNSLVPQLQQHLYQYCFTQKFTGQLLGELPMPSPDDN